MLGAVPPARKGRHWSSWVLSSSGVVAPTVRTHVVRNTLSIKAGKGYAIGVFDVPVSKVWRGVCDEDHHAGSLKVDRSETVEGKARAHGHTLYQFLDVPIVSDRWWLVQMSFNDRLYGASGSRAWELSWVDRQKDQALRARLGSDYTGKGVGVAWTKGAWLMVDLGRDRTFVEYHTWSDPGGKVPVGPATRFATSEVRNNLKSMVDFSVSHASTCNESFYKPDGTPLR